MAQIIWMGNASIQIIKGTNRLFVDPFIEFPGGEHANRVSDFLDAQEILITHGHFDHLYSIPEILKSCDANVYLTKKPADFLRARINKKGLVHEISPGDNLSLAGMTVKVVKGQHIQFDQKLVFKTIFSKKMFCHLFQGMRLGIINKIYKEYGETVMYEIIVDGRRVQVMGSLALPDITACEKGADLLVMPFQGNSYLCDCARKVIECLEPKRILLSHFDDAFPPISQTIDTSEIMEMVREQFPQIKMEKPGYMVPVEI